MIKDKPFVTNIKHEFLVKENGASLEYISGAQKAISVLREHITGDQWSDLEGKLQLHAGNFNVESYLQTACETTVTSSLVSKFPESFMYEPKIGEGGSNCDCSFFVDGFRFNVEVKCFDYAKDKEIRSGDKFLVGGYGRDTEQLRVINELLGALNSKTPDAFGKVQHMDNKVKDFLVKASKQFYSSDNDKHLNVLIVCANGPQHIQDVFGYLNGPQGLLTHRSYCPVSEYENVDLVVISNVYYRHDNSKQKEHLCSHWNLDTSFNVATQLTGKNGARKEHACNVFMSCFSNMNQELMLYKSRSSEPDLFLRVNLINLFVRDVLNPSGATYF
jgi:hypothetical protein